MRKIVAISGGEFKNGSGQGGTLTIDREIVGLCKKEKPGLLFIPTASRDSIEYCNGIGAYFSEEFNCNVSYLKLYDNPGIEEIKKKVLSADIIYTGGGNTYRMMKVWRRLGVDSLLFEAWQKGAVMSGMSAGAICWFRFGASDSWKFTNPDAGMIKVRGLGMVRMGICPHYDMEPERKEYLRRLIQNSPGVVLALDDCCAIEIIDDNYRIISSDDNANAYLVYWSKGRYTEELLNKESGYGKIDGLYGRKSNNCLGQLFEKHAGMGRDD
ncbi:MAG: Type 1 glutamine amidotransferase-like domain-containing protein [Clostridia bacterium]|nr:Type 1 glutamine amidotransferase-like domain-containing protein [Clostridia bacterium]